MGLDDRILCQHILDDRDHPLSDGIAEPFSFPVFLGTTGIILIGGGWVLGKLLVKRFKVQPTENYLE